MSQANKFIHFNTRAAFDAKFTELGISPEVVTGNPFYYYTIFIKETREVYTHGQFYAQMYVEDTYDNIKQLKESGSLTPGCKYRMIDYITTTVQENTRSAGHQFDIILTAVSTDQFDVKASAALHEGDTYFANSKIEEWQIWYTLENGENFNWSDPENGKGTIYRMIDEYYNDIKYDFKNIQFYITSKDDNTVYEWRYTFDYNYTDISLVEGKCFRNTFGIHSSIQQNVVIFLTDTYYFGDNFTDGTNNRFYVETLNNFYIKGWVKNSVLHDCRYISLHNRCLDSYLHLCVTCSGGSLYKSTLKKCERVNWNSLEEANLNYVWNSSFNGFSKIITIGTEGATTNTNGITMTGNCFKITIGSDCGMLLFDNCYYITIGHDCDDCTFRNYCSNLTIGDCVDHIDFIGVQNTTIPSYVKYGSFENCNWVDFTQEGASTYTLAKFLYAKGIHGNSDEDRLQIPLPVGLSTPTKIQKNSAGEVKIYNEADLIA